MTRRASYQNICALFARSSYRVVFLLAIAAVVLVAATSRLPSVEAAFPGENGKIVFTSLRDGDNDIYVANADGSDVVNLTNNTRQDSSPSWSPDGTKIVFASDRQGGPEEIYTMKSDGTRVVRLTNNAFGDHWPSWSPDGQRIVFISYRDGNAELYTMNADGTDQTRLTQSMGAEEHPVWSPDGSTIAFTRMISDRTQIFTMPSIGGEQTQLTNFTNEALSPDWSPDGSKILFQGHHSDNQVDIFYQDIGTSNVVNLTNTPSLHEHAPVWSPDGLKFSYAVNSALGGWDVYTADASGTSSIRITNHGMDDSEPDWQPVVPTPLNILISAVAAGTISNGMAYNVGDILRWDSAQWSLFYSGKAASLPKANINAFEVPDVSEQNVYLNFAQSLTVPGVSGPVAVHDIVAYDGATYTMFFDGSDEGLTTAGEKIDALAVLPGRISPIGDNCKNYLLISTIAGGSVEDANGGNLPFGGEDVLGFCQWHVGANTAGLWHKVIDGSAEGLPGGAIVSISATDDGLIVYFTTKGTFNADGVAGQPSKVYAFDMVSKKISGPYWSGNLVGFNGAVDGLQIIGELP